MAFFVFVKMEKAPLSRALREIKQLLCVQSLISSLYKTNRFHVAVHLCSNRSQRTSKCGKNISDTLGCRLVCHFFVLTTILTSSVIYYWTDARQHGIYLLNNFVNPVSIIHREPCLLYLIVGGKPPITMEVCFASPSCGVIMCNPSPSQASSGLTQT